MSFRIVGTTNPETGYNGLGRSPGGVADRPWSEARARPGANSPAGSPRLGPDRSVAVRASAASESRGGWLWALAAGVVGVSAWLMRRRG